MSSHETQSRTRYIVLPLLMLVLVFAFAFFLADASAAPEAQGFDVPGAESDAPSENLREVKASHRLIVELASPPLAAYMASSGRLPLNAQSPDAQSYVAQIEAEQATAISAMAEALPGATVATYINELEQEVEATYQITFNGFAVDPGETDTEEARAILEALPGVTAVYGDYAYYPDLYSSLELINAPALWAEPAVDGRENAGAGVKFASVDGGIHHEAPMFSGEGFECPPGYPLGEIENTNCKIIVSRVYFRSWDPPIPEDSFAWPAVGATPHGVHTSSTAVGNVVEDATYLGTALPTLSGVAPGAWAMSYRVFYNSVTGDGSFYTAEGIAALEDAVADGADVINNSWGGGPGSIGGPGDPLDTALINAVNAGVFVSMSAGNAGPGLGTTDHPSPDYIGVAATTKEGAYAAGRLDVTAPEPVTTTLQDIPFQPATFGEPLPLATELTYPFVPSGAVDAGNVLGCNPFPANAFDGVAALISRGVCEFGVKVLNAENAGAEFVVIYNNAGDGLISMGPGAVGDQVTISSIFIGQSAGEAMVDWYADNGSASELTLSTIAFPIDTDADYVINFSSRGPGVGNVLKPDIAAPGVNIMAQGYDPANAGTEAEHLGYGQVSGTSMASPHVAGSAAVILQAHPDWTPAQIKSALMTTSKYTDIWNEDGSPALPLDIGAGRLDLTNVTDPGVFLDPPSVGFGYVVSGTSPISQEVQVTSAATVAQTYNLSTITFGATFTDTIESFGFSVSPASITLSPGETETIVITFDPAEAMGIGEAQGYVVMDGSAYDAHMPVWARVQVPVEATGDVLILDDDASDLLGFPDYLGYYTSTLENLGITYDVWRTDDQFPNTVFVPEPAVLASYDAIIYYTGDHWQPNGFFTVPTPLTELDTNRLVEYANNGGVIIAMGQDAASVLQDTFFLGAILGVESLQDSVTDNQLPDQPVVPDADAPPAFDDIFLDLSGSGDGAGNQYYIEELEPQDSVLGLLEGEPDVFRELFRYPGPYNIDEGLVGIAHRDQPTLEYPTIDYLGRSIFTGFGLEGVNNYTETFTTREDLMQTFLNWAMDEPEASIDVLPYPEGSEVTVFEASVTSNISGTTGFTYRWDFGDGTGYFGPYESAMASHDYEVCGTFTVRVEVVDSWGNTAIGSYDVTVTEDCENIIYFPILYFVADEP